MIGHNTLISECYNFPPWYGHLRDTFASKILTFLQILLAQE